MELTLREAQQQVDEWIKTNLQNGKLNEIHLKYAGVPIPDEIVQGTGQ